ncbi:CREB-regulated transcription coactivator 1 [Liparis tanakae]|uniref:CREB-regulated transcription coactivator 1 n=1 Tax=Liparis tanakae TaxID=230148 RepID=A0A4Z2E627_9TELE|nr:CREB-regulated transcription coactivator 1 [Liparis tanakae]
MCSRFTSLHQNVAPGLTDVVRLIPHPVSMCRVRADARVTCEPPLSHLPMLVSPLQESQSVQLGPNRGPNSGGSLPDVSQVGNGTFDGPFQVSPQPPSVCLAQRSG